MVWIATKVTSPQARAPADAIGGAQEGHAAQGREAYQRDSDAEQADGDAEPVGDLRGTDGEDGEVVDLEEADEHQRRQDAPFVRVEIG